MNSNVSSSADGRKEGGVDGGNERMTHVLDGRWQRRRGRRSGPGRNHPAMTARRRCAPTAPSPCAIRIPSK